LNIRFHFVSLVLKYAYAITAPSDHPTVNIYSHLTWNEVVPLKMFIFAWRQLNKGIFTKDNLSRREMVPSSSLLCSRGCGNDETIICFLNVIFSLVFGVLFFDGWVSLFENPAYIGEQVLQFDGALLFRKKICSCLLVIWMSCVLIILKKNVDRHNLPRGLKAL